MDVKRKVAIATMGVLGVAGLGVGTALAQTGGPSPAKPAATAATAQATPTTAGPDTDAVQEGAQAAPDKPGTADEKEAPESGEKAGVEERGDANLPGGGHADPAGNVDHQFEGQE